MEGKEVEEYQAKQLKIDDKFLQKLDELIRVAQKAEVNDKEIFTKALDDIVNVNSLFAIATFVGLSLASGDQYSLENRPECHAGPAIAKRLVNYEVVSFACLVFSSLLAKSLNVYHNLYPADTFQGQFFFRWGRILAFSFAAVASIVGIASLTLAITNVVQIKVGKFSCGSNHAVAAVVSLSVIVAMGVLIYSVSMVFTIIRIICMSGQVSSNDKNI